MKLKLISMTVVAALQAHGAEVFNDQGTIDSLRNELAEISQHALDIQNLADAESRPLLPEEVEQVDELLAKFEVIKADIKRRELIQANADALTQPQRGGRQTQPDTPDGPQANAQQTQQGKHAPAYRQPRDPVAARRNGFNHFGEFAAAVIPASRPGNPIIDNRLQIQNAPTTYGQEGVGEDGGFAVPPEFRDEIMQLVASEGSLLERTDGLTSTSNTLTLPVDETTDWQTTGGIQSYWDGEADQMTQSKPALKERSMRLNRLTTLVPITDDLLEDASGLESWLRKKAPAKMNFKITNAIINGDGAGKPQGFMNSGSLVTVAKETGQTADTIVAANISKMWARMYAESRLNAVWLINQDIEPQLDQLMLEGTSSSIPVYLPPGGFSDSPYARLKGRPVIPTQAAATLGDLGDIMLVDLKSYMTIMKTGGMRTDVSMHLFFDYNMTAFRFVIRMAGQSWFASAISPLNGSNTLSPFVTLAARA